MVPRLPDGHPDRQGVWTNATITPLERPAALAGKATLTDAEAAVFEKQSAQELQEADGKSEGPLFAAAGSSGTGAYNVLYIDRGTPGVTYSMLDSFGHRLTPNSAIIFEDARVPAANLVEGTHGNGDLLINRNFAWSGPVAGIAAVGVARAA